MAKKAKDAPTGGDCYSANGSMALNHESEDVVLVHGFVTDPVSGKRLSHCWVELGDRVIDKSQGHDLDVTREWYYQHLSVEPDPKRYTKFQLAIAMGKNKHWGPWPE